MDGQRRFKHNIGLRHLTVYKQARRRVCAKISHVLDSILFSGGTRFSMGFVKGGKRDQLNCPASYPLLLTYIKLNEHRASS